MYNCIPVSRIQVSGIQGIQGIPVSRYPGIPVSPGGKTLFSQEVGAKLKRRVQGLRHSEFDLLQLCVCNCTRSPSGSATSVPPYKCTRFKDYFEFVIAIDFFWLRSPRTFLQVYRS